MTQSTRSTKNAGGSVDSGFKSNNQHAEDVDNVAEKTSRVETVKDFNDTNDVRSKDVSSTEASSKCFTQDFDSNEGVASPFGHVKEGTQCAEEIQIENEESKENIDSEQHHDDDPVEFENNQGGSFALMSWVMRDKRSSMPRNLMEVKNR